jgi:hypothetical protein
LKIRLAFLSGLLAVLCCASALSQDYTRFPGESPDQRTLKTQERVDELYKAGDFKRALFIYEKELAPRGDKYAQYMVGFMHLSGQGVPTDVPRALAWYRLAAERGHGALESARDELAANMTQDEINASNRIFLGLLQEIGDTKLIMALIQKDMDTLKGRTGTRIAGSNVTAPILILRPSGMAEDPDYFRNVRRRLESRLNYLETTVEISDIAVESENDELQQFEEQIKSELAAIEVP